MPFKPELYRLDRFKAYLDTWLELEQIFNRDSGRVIFSPIGKRSEAVRESHFFNKVRMAYRVQKQSNRFDFIHVRVAQGNDKEGNPIWGVQFTDIAPMTKKFELLINE